MDAGWGALTMELNLAASLRTAQRHGGDQWPRKDFSMPPGMVFADRWLNIPARPLTAPLGGGTLDVADEDAGVRNSHSMASLNVQDVGRQVLEYLNAGYPGIGCFMRWGGHALG